MMLQNTGKLNLVLFMRLILNSRDEVAVHTNINRHCLLVNTERVNFVLCMRLTSILITLIFILMVFEVVSKSNSQDDA